MTVMDLVKEVCHGVMRERDVMSWSTVVLWVEWSISEEPSLFFWNWMVWVNHVAFVMLKFWVVIEFLMVEVSMMEFAMRILKLVISFMWESLMVLKFFMELWDHVWLRVVVWWFMHLVGVLTFIVRLHNVIVDIIRFMHWSIMCLVCKMVLNGVSFWLLVNLMDKRFPIDMRINESVMIVFKVILWVFLVMESVMWFKLLFQSLYMQWVFMIVLVW